MAQLRGMLIPSTSSPSTPPKLAVKGKRPLSRSIEDLSTPKGRGTVAKNGLRVVSEGSQHSKSERKIEDDSDPKFDDLPRLIRLLSKTFASPGCEVTDVRLAVGALWNAGLCLCQD